MIATCADVASADDDFRDRVAPILESRCLRCHGHVVKKGGLSLVTSESLNVGGDIGRLVQ